MQPNERRDSKIQSMEVMAAEVGDKEKEGYNYPIYSQLVKNFKLISGHINKGEEIEGVEAAE